MIRNYTKMNYKKPDLEHIHPNPTMQRADWESLNGKWTFEFLEGKGLPRDKTTINVPFSYETKASGIGNEKVATKVRYSRIFDVKRVDSSVLLHFAAVDYRCEVWVNDVYAGGHVGGYTAFCLDITRLVAVGQNRLVVVAYDSLSKAQLRGKQRARTESYECWYVQTTGIWKDVWLEYAGKNYIESVEITPHTDGNVDFCLRTSMQSGNVSAVVSLDGKTVANGSAVAHNGEASFSVNVGTPALWSADSPKLYGVRLASDDDVVDSYFGIRTIATDSGKVTINGVPTYLRTVLEQGYWYETGLTAPSAADLWKEAELIKRLGFNGVRMHQKTESALFYYFCDLLGLYVWGEIPSNYEYSDEAQAEMMRDCPQIIRQLSPHPSIIAWVIFNESWGIPRVKNDIGTQRYVEAVCNAVRAADNTRLVIGNDGWHQLDGDLLTLHEYNQNADCLAADYSNKEIVVGNKLVINTYGYAYADGYEYRGQPVLLSEFGGIAINESEGWGYGAKAEDKDAFFKRFVDIMAAVGKLDYLAGYCYTQLTDVQQETNGLCYVDRTPKVDEKKIRHIICGK